MKKPSFRKLLALGILPLAAFFASCSLGFDEGEAPAAKAPAGGVAEQRLEWIKATKKFKVAVCPQRPPLVFKNEKGMLGGIELELVVAIAKELDLEPLFFECSQEQVSGLLRVGNADLACVGIDGPSIARQYLEPALDYMPSGQRLVVRSEGAAFVNSPKQFDSDKITLITVAGSTGSKVAEKLFPNAKRISVKNFETAISELKGSENAAVLADNMEIIGRDDLKGYPKVKPVLSLLTNESLCMAIRRNDNVWKGLLEMGMRKARTSGEIGRIIGRYFPNVSCEFVTLSADFSSGKVHVEVGTPPADSAPEPKDSKKLPASTP